MCFTFFPKHVANQLHARQNVRLTNFGAATQAVAGAITKIQPVLNNTIHLFSMR